MNKNEDPGSDLTAAERLDLQRLAGIMIPASQAYGVPGADDETIFADIVRSLGRDRADVKIALAMLDAIADGNFSRLNTQGAQTAAMSLLARDTAAVMALGRAVLQCYYRDERVMRALGIEPVAPFPNGRALEQGDWSLLDAVRGRPPLWRDDRKAGA